MSGANSTLQSKRIFTPKFYFTLGIIFNLCLLGFFKYTDFFLENFNTFAKLANLDFEIPLPHILLPLALSFVTFQQIAFLYDCYKCTKGELSENLNVNFVDYALFVSFFPQLIAGPIVHHREMMPQFSKLGNSSLKSPLPCGGGLGVGNEPQNTQNPTNLSQNSRSIINYEFLSKGIFIFSIGLFKKVFIADTFAKWADAGFKVVENGGFLNIFESWATSLSYTFQLYFDFSGYCDMAMGLGLMFGIMLPLNFNSPYKSLNIAEFWRKWHITLGRFLKECVYIPLGGNRFGKFLTLRNLFIVAFLSGVWHGAGWGFVIWGVLHGIAMLIHRIYSWWVDYLSKSPYPASEIPNQKSPSLAEGDLGGGCENATNAKNSQNSVNLKINSKENLQNANFTHPQTPSAREGALPLDNAASQGEGASMVATQQRALKRNLTTKFLNFTQTKSYKILCWFLTFNFINLAWIFFRAENLQGALNLLKSMFGVVWVELPQKWHRMPESLAQISGRNDTIFYIIIAVLVCVLAKNSFELVQNFRSNAFKFSLLLKFNARAFSKKILLKGGVVFVKFLVSVGLFWVSVWLLLLSLFASNTYSPFIYFNF